MKGLPLARPKSDRTIFFGTFRPASQHPWAMMPSHFDTFVVDSDPDPPMGARRRVPAADLPEGEVTVAVSHSALNHQAALAPREKRAEIQRELPGLFTPNSSAELDCVVSLAEVRPASRKLLAGRVRSRMVVRIGTAESIVAPTDA